MNICFFGTYDRNYSRNQILLKGLPQAGVEVIEVHKDLSIIKLDKKGDISSVAILYRFLRKFLFLPVLFSKITEIRKSDILLCPYPAHLDLPLCFFVAKIFGKPVIFDPLFSLTDVFINDFGILPGKSLVAYIFKKIEGFIFSLPDIILADTPYQSDNYQKLFGLHHSRIKIIPLGADNSLYKSTPIKKRNDKFRVIYFGLYNPVHGLEFVVEAARILKREDLEFLFIGEGQTYNNIVSLVKKYKLSNIDFLKLKEKEAIPILQKADVFLGLFGASHTVFRTIANKVLQGLSLGKAVITSQGAAINSVFKDHQHLLLVKPQDGQAIARAILEIKNNPALKKKLEENGYKIFNEKFTPRAVGLTLKKVIIEGVAD